MVFPSSSVWCNNYEIVQWETTYLIKSVFTLVTFVSLCRFIRLQTLQDISVKCVYSAADSFLFIILITAFLQENTDWMSIYSLAGKKTLNSDKLCRDLAEGIFRSLLETWCKTFSALHQWGHSHFCAKNRSFSACWSRIRFTSWNLSSIVSL